jgi:hypothetical protein
VWPRLRLRLLRHFDLPLLLCPPLHPVRTPTSHNLLPCRRRHWCWCRLRGGATLPRRRRSTSSTGALGRQGDSLHGVGGAYPINVPTIRAAIGLGMLLLLLLLGSAEPLGPPQSGCLARRAEQQRRGLQCTFWHVRSATGRARAGHEGSLLKPSGGPSSWLRRRGVVASARRRSDRPTAAGRRLLARSGY